MSLLSETSKVAYWRISTGINASRCPSIVEFVSGWQLVASKSVRGEPVEPPSSQHNQLHIKLPFDKLSANGVVRRSHLLAHQ